jgi:hypothetical protein
VSAAEEKPVEKLMTNRSQLGRRFDEVAGQAFEPGDQLRLARAPAAQQQGDLVGAGLLVALEVVGPMSIGRSSSAASLDEVNSDINM